MDEIFRKRRVPDIDVVEEIRTRTARQSYVRSPSRSSLPRRNFLIPTPASAASAWSRSPTSATTRPTWRSPVRAGHRRPASGGRGGAALLYRLGPGLPCRHPLRRLADQFGFIVSTRRRPWHPLLRLSSPEALKQRPQRPAAIILYLPSYSPDLNPIEQFFSKLKALLRQAAERTIPNLCRRIRLLLRTVCPEECTNFLRHAGYVSTSEWEML